MNYQTFMIYNEYYPNTKSNMLDSISTYNQSWNIQPYDGCSPDTLSEYEEKYNLPKTDRYKKFVNQQKYTSKKCCFYSHYSLWTHCADHLDYIVIVENDVEAVSSFPNSISDFIKNHKDSLGMQITTESMTLFTKRNKKHHAGYVDHEPGIHSIYHKNSTGKHYLMGATGYILNNKACKYLIKDCQLNGWAQNDLLFNADDDFNLYFIKPSIAYYNKEKENNTSSRKL